MGSRREPPAGGGRSGRGDEAGARIRSDAHQYTKATPQLSGVAVLGAVLFAATLAVGAWWLMVPQPGEASRTTVAVLPFENIAAEPGEDHFAAGMRAEIMSQLPRSRNCG